MAVGVADRVLVVCLWVCVGGWVRFETRFMDRVVDIVKGNRWVGGLQTRGTRDAQPGA